MNCWQTLGIAPTGDEAAIKTAYAALIRQHRPDRDPAGFRRVRAAYEEALRLRPYYENHRDEPRYPAGWTPGKSPVAADDSDAESVSQHEPSQPYLLAEPAAHDYRDTPPAAPEQPYPLSEPAARDYCDTPPAVPEQPYPLAEPAAHDYRDTPPAAPEQPYPLAEPAAHDYRDTPPAAPEQPYPLSEPAAHDYQDGSAHPILTPLEATVLLRQLQQAWQGLDDAALLAILQAQATHPALDNIDFRLDYTGALTACLDDGDYPHSRLWVQQHYGLQDPDSRRLLADLIAADGDPALRDSILTAHYPALVAWLKQNRLRRWWALRRRFLNCDPGPVWQDWRRLYDDTGDVSDEHYLTAWPRLRELMRYHLPLAGLRYGWFIDIAIFFLLPAYAAYTGPRPNPYAAYRCITCPAAPATSPEPGLPLASILITWLLLRGAHILWRTKYAVSAGWLPPRPQDGLSLHITRVAYILGLIYSLIPPNWRPLPAQTLAQTLTATLSLILYGHAWCRLPPEAVNLRRAMLDHGVIAILIVAACIIGNLPGSDEHAFIVKTPLLTALSLITAPALALVLIYSYAPPLPNRKTAKHLATAATILMALGISAISYNVFRKDIPGPVAVLLGLIVAVFITARNPPRPETIHRSLAALIHFLALACLYILAYVAMLNLVGNLKDYTGDARPGIILLASLILHSIATLSHYNWQRKHT